MHESFVSNSLPFLFRKRRLGIPADRPHPARLVVPRHPAVSVNCEALLVGNHRVTGQKELRQPPIISVLFSITPHSNDETIIRFLYSEPRRLVQKMIFR